MGQQYSHLSSEERILIEKLHCEQHLSVRKIAEEIGRDKSTVSRELRRGLWFASNENGSYRPYRPKRLKTGPWTSGPFYSALAAQRKADLRRRGSRKPRRMDSDRLRAWVLDSLRRGWSPELIEGRLKAQYAGDPSMRISHECLCQWIYCLCSISCCGFSHDDFSGLGRACRPRNGLNWMVLVSPPERTGKDYDQHAPSTVYPSFAAERGIRRVDRAENTCQRADGA
ncbi:hypothetical protein F010042H6_17360 [Bifidobacterium longum]